MCQQAGGPGYPVFTGRKDGMRSDAASVDIPSPSVSWQEALAYFKSRGLNVLDMGTLLGKTGLKSSSTNYYLLFFSK